jgi:hypothetical protein
MGEMRMHAILCSEEGKRPLGRHRYRWKDNIRMVLREIEWEVVDWMRFRIETSVGPLGIR